MATPHLESICGRVIRVLVVAVVIWFKSLNVKWRRRKMFSLSFNLSIYLFFVHSFLLYFFRHQNDWLYLRCVCVIDIFVLLFVLFLVAAVFRVQTLNLSIVVWIRIRQSVSLKQIIASVCILTGQHCRRRRCSLDCRCFAVIRGQLEVSQRTMAGSVPASSLLQTDWIPPRFVLQWTRQSYNDDER